MQREFVYTGQFEKAWKALDLSDEDLVDLENELLKNPQAGKVISGTNGLRKYRIPANGHGKRGGARVLYVDFIMAQRIYFITAYAKNEKDDLTKDEKKQLAAMIETLARENKRGGC